MENNLIPPNAGENKGQTALILAILAFIFFFIPYCSLLSIPLGIASIIFGSIGLSQAKKANAPVSKPKTGLIAGVAVTSFIILCVVGVISFMAIKNIGRKEKMENTIRLEISRKRDSVNAKIDTTKIKKNQ
ncbi:hypothetical protein [Flavobacterium sp. N1736]|uniref:hypothetical protein n=1 Tax=Flavobacterium sp. N1736 TaxID=2986823 RepID=UPI0022253B70|nr:hypothetical protein [Flavobacterium sp. N1736]